MARPGVAVIGGGAWGLALAGAAARTGGPTLLFSRRAHDGVLPWKEHGSSVTYAQTPCALPEIWLRAIASAWLR